MEKNRIKLLFRLSFSKSVTFIFLTCVFVGMLFVLPEYIPWSAKATMSIMVYGLLLWAMEPIPLGLTSVLVLVLLLLLQAVEMDIVLSGFSSPAVFLIIAGMMMAKGVNQTGLINRVTFLLLAKWGDSAKGIFVSNFLLMQIQGFFIPSTAVRTSLMLPLVRTTLTTIEAKKGTNFSKLLLIGTAYAGSISGTAILTAAVGNILTVELLHMYVGRSLSYVEWFIYALPIWLLLIIIIPIILWKCFPPENYSFKNLQNEMRNKKKDIGPLSNAEKKCIWILGLTILIWIFEPFHGYHPTLGALLAVILMTLPRIGFVEWKKIVEVNFDMVLLIGSTLSLGFALIDSGAIDLLEELVTPDAILEIVSNPWIAILIVIVVSQIYHLGVTNVSTAVVTLLPVFIGLSQQAGLDPVVLSLAAAITILLGYLLVVETMSNVVVHSTGMIDQKDFFIPGILSTVASTIITLIVAYSWWRWLGFWP